MVKVNLEINEEIKEFSIPQNWEEVNVEQFINLFSFEREGVSEFKILTKTINIFTGIDEDLLMMMNYNDFQQIVEVLSFTSKDLEPEVVDYVEIDGETYFLKKDFDKYTMGEIISIETLLSSSESNILKVMDKLLCIFLRKKNENGKFEPFTGDMMDRVEIFRKAPVSKIHHIFTFFLDGGTLSTTNTKDYSVKQK
jgi:hypothetical protein